MIRLGRVEAKAYQLLQDFNTRVTPVPVEQIAERLKLIVQIAPFDGNLSGILYRDEQSTIIGVNEREPEKRRRFTIAHEIGHFLLHDGVHVHLDSKVSLRLNYRNEISSSGTDLQEIEANAFAAALLMPENLVRERFNSLFVDGIDPTEEDEQTANLANEFGVSQQAMMIRLSRLGLLERIY